MIRIGREIAVALGFLRPRHTTTEWVAYAREAVHAYGYKAGIAAVSQAYDRWPEDRPNIDRAIMHIMEHGVGDHIPVRTAIRAYPYGV